MRHSQTLTSVHACFTSLSRLDVKSSPLGPSLPAPLPCSWDGHMYFSMRIWRESSLVSALRNLIWPKLAAPNKSRFHLQLPQSFRSSWRVSGVSLCVRACVPSLFLSCPVLSVLPGVSCCCPATCSILSRASVCHLPSSIFQAPDSNRPDSTLSFLPPIFPSPCSPPPSFPPQDTQHNSQLSHAGQLADILSKVRTSRILSPSPLCPNTRFACLSLSPPQSCPLRHAALSPPTNLPTLGSSLASAQTELLNLDWSFFCLHFGPLGPPPPRNRKYPNLCNPNPCLPPSKKKQHTTQSSQ